MFILLILQQLSVSPKKNQFKSALAGLRKYLETDSSLKVMKNAFYFSLNALFVLKITI